MGFPQEGFSPERRERGLREQQRHKVLLFRGLRELFFFFFFLLSLLKCFEKRKEEGKLQMRKCLSSVERWQSFPRPSNMKEKDGER